MSKVIAVMDKPEECRFCSFLVCNHYTSSQKTRQYFCDLKNQNKIYKEIEKEEFGRDEEVHLSNCPLCEVPLLEAKKNCGEDSDCSECPFGQIEDRCILQELQIEHNNGWISCSERLPEDEQRCLIYYKSKIGCGVDIDMFSVNAKEFQFYGIKNVIAWQPLPEPYTEGE